MEKIKHLISKKLVTLYKDVPLNLHYSDLKAHFNIEKATNFFQELNFKSLINRLSHIDLINDNDSNSLYITKDSDNKKTNDDVINKLKVNNHEYKTVKTIKDLKSIIHKIKEKKIFCK